jgi:hypothetical protein
MLVGLIAGVVVALASGDLVAGIAWTLSISFLFFGAGRWEQEGHGSSATAMLLAVVAAGASVAGQSPWVGLGVLAGVLLVSTGAGLVLAGLNRGMGRVPDRDANRNAVSVSGSTTPAPMESTNDTPAAIAEYYRNHPSGSHALLARVEIGRRELQERRMRDRSET